MKLGRQRKSHKGRAAIRHYANLREPSFKLCLKLYRNLLPTLYIKTSALGTAEALGDWTKLTNKIRFQFISTCFVENECLFIDIYKTH